ncbi:MAG: type VI secretion system baseplate subunit TssE [Planctomycetales bacterium]|nr:type VI secretion system baseplate subunit TssE [Planctomycetales bacterium]
MARPLDDEPLRASLLDRLSGSENHGKFAGRQTLEQLIASVHRDLEKLLNTRWRVTSWPPNLNELECSLVNYGIPDFAGVNMSSPAEREIFKEMVREAIQLHERRFIKVKVHIVDNEDGLDRTLRFKIDALLRASPEPAEVQFDSQVDPTSHRIKISSRR